MHCPRCKRFTSYFIDLYEVKPEGEETKTMVCPGCIVELGRLNLI